MSLVLLRIMKELTKERGTFYTRDIVNELKKKNVSEIESLFQNLKMLELKGFVKGFFDDKKNDYIWTVSLDKYYKDLSRSFSELLTYSLYSTESSMESD